ncbi:MAG: PAS domain S-box protein [Nitrospinae bacterium]|nr:PAS domain S-box protein [Nitrospinota bacterium]
MSLKTKTLSAAIVFVLIFLGFALAASQLVFLPSFEALEAAEVSHHLDQAASHINDESKNMGLALSDWSQWDETYEFASGGAKGYIQSNFASDSFATLKTNFIIITNKNLAPVFARGEDLSAGNEIAVPGALLREIADPASPIGKVSRSGRASLEGVLSLPEGLLLVAARPILRTSGEGPVNGVLFWARFLSGEEVERIARQLKLSVAIHDLRKPGMAPDFAGALGAIQAGEPRPVIPLDEHNVAAYATLDDIHGQPALIIKAANSREVLRQGKNTIWYFITLLIIGGVALTGAAAYFLNRQVVGRVLGLASAAGSISLEQDALGRIPAEGRDEIASLALAINAMLQKIESEISRRTASEKMLRVNERRLETLMRLLPVGVFYTDPKGNFRYVNPAWLNITGVAIEQALGKGWLHTLSGEDTTRVFEEWNTALGEKKTFHSEFRFARPGEAAVWVLATALAEHDRAGNVTGYVGTLTDITARKNAETTLMWQEKLASLGALSAGVAHEILNPLNIISNNTQLLQIEDRHPRIQNGLATIMEQVNRIVKIVDALRVLTHPRKPAVEPVDPRALAEKTALLVEHEFELNHISIERDFGGDVPLIFVDADKLAQVMLNILNNARDAMKTQYGDRVTIRIGRVENTVRIVISDNGPGIPPEILNRVFDPFFTTKGPGRNPGLGLSVAFLFLQRMKGKLEVSSVYGQGAAFTITLPVESADDGEEKAFILS